MLKPFHCNKVCAKSSTILKGFINFLIIKHFIGQKKSSKNWLPRMATTQLDAWNGSLPSWTWKAWQERNIWPHWQPSATSHSADSALTLVPKSLVGKWQWEPIFCRLGFTFSINLFSRDCHRNSPSSKGIHPRKFLESNWPADMRILCQKQCKLSGIILKWISLT